jgi:serine phosphatase RsbU (regulator of sigma subunit)
MRRASLEIHDHGAMRTVALTSARVLIGRDEDCALRLAHEYVSRRHAEITEERGRHFVRDLDSRYGVYVNDQRVSHTPIFDSDRIRLGLSGGPELVFRFHDTGAAGAESAVRTEGLRHVALLLEGLRALGSGRVLEEVLAIVLDSAIELAEAERGCVMLADAAGILQIRLARARGRKPLDHVPLIVSRQVPEQVFATGTPAAMYDLDQPLVRDAHPHTLNAGIRAALCVPLRLARPAETGGTVALDRRTLGVLYLDSGQRTEMLSPAGRTALEALADEAAVAIENARLYRDSLERARLNQDLRRAAEMQLALLPARRYRADGVEIAGDTVPSRLVGGDFFDYFRSARGQVLFTLGDVAGKGLPAALLAAQTQGMFAAWANAGADPGQVVRRLNETLARRELQASFVTLVCACLNPETGALTLCNAGHQPALVLRADGRVESYDTGGVVLGPFEDAEYAVDDVQLRAGDVVVLYSDGVTEAANDARERFGAPRLMSAIRSCQGCSADELVARILHALAAFADIQAPADDITVLAVRYPGAQSRAPIPSASNV